MAFHFHHRPGLVILQLVVLLVTVKAGLAAGFPRPAMAKASRLVAAASFVARSLPGLGRFAIADLVIAADPFALAGSDPAAVAGSAGFAVDSAAIVSVAAGPDYAVAADLACSVFGSVCSFAAETGKGRAVVGISCFLTPRSSF